MKFNRISTAKIQESVDIERLIASQYPDNYLGMPQIQIPQDGGQSIEILKAYLGWEPRKLCFGQIIAILKYKNRLFKVRFHVWREFQPAALANRMRSISRFARNVADCLETVRMLNASNVGVIFEKEGIDTRTESGDVCVALYCEIARRESESITSNLIYPVGQRM